MDCHWNGSVDPVQANGILTGSRLQSKSKSKTMRWTNKNYKLFNFKDINYQLEILSHGNDIEMPENSKSKMKLSFSIYQFMEFQLMEYQFNEISIGFYHLNRKLIIENGDVKLWEWHVIEKQNEIVIFNIWYVQWDIRVHENLWDFN